MVMTLTTPLLMVTSDALVSACLYVIPSATSLTVSGVEAGMTASFQEVSIQATRSSPSASVTFCS